MHRFYIKNSLIGTREARKKSLCFQEPSTVIKGAAQWFFPILDVLLFVCALCGCNFNNFHLNVTPDYTSSASCCPLCASILTSLTETLPGTQIVSFTVTSKHSSTREGGRSAIVKCGPAAQSSRISCPPAGKSPLTPKPKVFSVNKHPTD